MVLVVTLTVRRARAEAFRRFEREAARIMKKHGGTIERVVAIRDGGGQPPDEHFREVHLVTFPDDAAYAAYRQDPELYPLSTLREAAVVATYVLIGDAAAPYGEDD